MALADPPAEKAEAEAPKQLIAKRLDLDLEVNAPKYAVVGQPFTVEVKAHNVGHFTLSDMVGGIRATGSTKPVSGPSKNATRKQLKPGQHWVLRESFIAQSTGPARISMSFREGRGWAASGGYVSVDVQPTPPPKSGKQPTADVNRLDMQVGVTDVPLPKAGKAFPVSVWVTNTGDLALGPVILAVDTRGAVSISVKSKRRIEIKKLAKNETRVLTVQCTLDAKADPKKVALVVSAREGRGWTSAGAHLPIRTKP